MTDSQAVADDIAKQFVTAEPAQRALAKIIARAFEDAGRHVRQFESDRLPHKGGQDEFSEMGEVSWLRRR